MKKYIGADISELKIDESITAKGKNSLIPKASVITVDDAISLCKEYAQLVREQIDSNALIFLFGSIIKGTANTGSDIDTAIVSKKLDDDFFAVAARLSSLAHNFSWDIEVHAIAYEDWRKGNPHVFEIQKWGVAV